ncbi:MAG: hypothetical protein M1827_005998 [Pycnora praestabilis]|nr:MAG: hypothetical protein M1827_005998 [Pycnora praestabilis]
MLITPRTYALSQHPDKGTKETSGLLSVQPHGWYYSSASHKHIKKMLLVHQTGSVKVGEIVRYTITYTPSIDRILPSPSHLYVKIKNTSAIPLRAAYLHGPYTLYVATYPSTFSPNRKIADTQREGVPDFEPNLKAGGHWTARLTVPEDVRETAGKVNAKHTTYGEPKRVTWIIEISSQVIFSNSAAVHYELLVGRDEKSLDLGFAAIAGQGGSVPGQVHDHQQPKQKRNGHHEAQPKGVYSRAVSLDVDDTEGLWSKPPLPAWDDDGKDRGTKLEYPGLGEEEATTTQKDRAAGRRSTEAPKSKKQRQVHLVILTHGLHSNLGADMLYVKESIDVAARQAKEDARKRRAKNRERERHQQISRQSSSEQKSPEPGISRRKEYATQEETDGGEDEEVIVRGFSGNAVRTERGIQYLGKRLAKWVLAMTYPDQPYLPLKRSTARKLSLNIGGQDDRQDNAGHPVHAHSSIYRRKNKPEELAYKITSISFIGHSLGGLTQTYAIAYIQKHSPQFFELIKPINFVCMAAPMLGLSNENPVYVKFALDFGLVGRTGKDLGLTWRAPTIARSGWGAMVGGLGGLGAGSHDRSEHQDPRSKPLLRILPSGPAHQVLKKFRNRTLYSNVVNDGIVPLRTSCLLFLDWRGLDRVEKARRENGLVGTMVGWGWAEMTGANSTSHRSKLAWADGADSGTSGDDVGDEGNGGSKMNNHGATVPQPSDIATNEDQEPGSEPQANRFLTSDAARLRGNSVTSSDGQGNSPPQHSSNPLSGLLSLLRPNQEKSSHHKVKNPKIYSRSQTRKADNDEPLNGDRQSFEDVSSTGSAPALRNRPAATRGDSIIDDPNNVFAPPKTSFFESAGDVLNPPLPPTDFLIDPSNRPRTIFHDRIYHPEDIPPPPIKRRTGLRRSFSTSDSIPKPDLSLDAPNSRDSIDSIGAMKVEEKIARAYHRDLSWRKVLVRLEPDAHNNMIVRRMFANAYGWPVVKHMVDTHFADTYVAVTPDDDEPSKDRAKGIDQDATAQGEEVQGQMAPPNPRTTSEQREASDEVGELGTASITSDVSIGSFGGRPRMSRDDSAQWSDGVFEGTDYDDDDLNMSTPMAADYEHDGHADPGKRHKGTSEAEIADFLSTPPARNGQHQQQQQPLPPDQPEESEEPGPKPEMVYPTADGPSGPTDVGFRNSAEEHVGSPETIRRSVSKRQGNRDGVVEEVAKLSFAGG